MMEMQRKDRDKSQMYAALKYSEQFASGDWASCALCRSFSLTARRVVVAVSLNITLRDKMVSVGRRARG